MIIINFVCISFILFGLITGNPDPFTFLVSNKFGQLSLESPTQTRVLVDGLIAPNAFDYSFNDKLVFYVGDHQTQHSDFISVIKAFNLTDFRAHNVYKFDHGAINALAVDWHNMMIYWADFKEEYIAVGEVNLDLITITRQKIIVSNNMSNLRSICVDPVSRSLFWLRSEESTLIESSGLDGSERKTILEDLGVMARDLKIDRSINRLVWFDEIRNRFGSCNFEGGDVTYISTPDLGPDRPQLLTAFGGRIFFYNDLSISSVLAKDKIPFSTMVHRRFGHQIYAAMVFSGADRIQIPMKGNFTCLPEKFRHLSTADETGCNFLCLSSPSKPQYTCTCPTGISSSRALSSPISTKGESQINLSNSYMCPKNPEKFLLVARPPKIFMLSLDGQLTDSPLWPIGTSPNPRGTLVRVDFDPKSEYIYWVDNAIYRLKLGERKCEEIISWLSMMSHFNNTFLQISTGEKTLDGLAVDWIVGNLYWSTGGNRQIWVSRLDGAWPRLLLTLEDFDAGAGSSASGGGDKESADVLGDPYSDET
ncbi:unnamed protein product, partial [Rodentolepis nana]|uniref:Low-density lipoprotein receptor-related protein 6 n=1 Tax=Rodentolepis nana TaxID=102285 RepID=A0A0R3T714_RODNA